MRKNWVILIFIIFWVLACAPTYIWTSAPEINKKSNDYFIVTVKPVGLNNRFDSFILSITNKSKEDMELDWNKTLFLDNGKTNGGFMFEGVIYKDRNNPKSPDIIFASSTFNKKIWPCNLVGFGDRWYHQPLSNGNQGVYLTVRVNGNEIHEKIYNYILIQKHK